jgi:hypothetical protein
MLGASAPVHMAFYVKQRLDCGLHITPIYILARESEALAAKARAEQEQAQAQARTRELGG